MKVCKAITVLVLVIMMSIQLQAQTVSKELEAEIKGQIEEQWEHALGLLHNLDAEGCQELFSKTEFKGDMVNGIVLWPKEKYFESLKNWFASRKSQKFVPNLVDIRVLTSEFALLDCADDVFFEFKNGDKKQIHHCMSFLYKKGPVGWRVIHMHESTQEVFEAE